jgi:hypothetical protein
MAERLQTYQNMLGDSIITRIQAYFTGLAQIALKGTIGVFALETMARG